jgi:GNAT superfamily N-acetyltransferase
MTRGAVSIRPAMPGDLDSLAAIHEAAAREGYRHIFPADASFPLDEVRADLHRHLTCPDAHILLAEIGCAAAGFIAVGPMLAGEGEGLGGGSSGSPGQTYLLHVHPAHWRGGLGSALHDRALAALAADGFTSAIMWVLERDERARHFYERRGWQADGGRRRERYAIEIDVVRYRRALV